MAIESYFFDAIKDGTTYDRTYSAQDFTDYLELVVGNGVFPNPSNQLQVLANGGMAIKVAKGQGWIAGHKIKNMSDLILTISASDVLLNRIDRAIFFVDYSLRNMGIVIKKGTNAVTPTPPPLVRNSQRWEMCLAEITINKQTTSIVQSVIKDTRMSSDLCGFVQGLVQQASTETLFTQWDDANTSNLAKNQSVFTNSMATIETGFNTFIVTSKQAYDDWFNSIKDEILRNTLVRQTTTSESILLDVAANKLYFLTSLAAEQFNINRDILNLYLNGLRLIKNSEYVIELVSVSGTAKIAVKFKKAIQRGAMLECELLKCTEEV